MLPASMLFRIAKTVSVTAIGLMAVIIVIGNTTDYWTNYLFVEHVMRMDTTFSDSNTHYRSIQAPLFMQAIFSSSSWNF